MVLEVSSFISKPKILLDNALTQHTTLRTPKYSLRKATGKGLFADSLNGWNSLFLTVLSSRFVLQRVSDEILWVAFPKLQSLENIIGA